MSSGNKGFTDLSLKRLISKIKSTFVDKTDAVETTSVNVDSVPTAGSYNLITSGGVYNAIDAMLGVIENGNY